MSSEKKEVENTSIIAWIAEKLKNGYSPLSIEDVLEEKGYDRLHAQELVGKIAKEGDFGRHIKKKVIRLSFSDNGNIKKFFLPVAAILFALSLIFMYLGKETVVKIIVSFISLAMAIIIGFKFVKKISGMSTIGAAKTSCVLFIVIVMIYYAITVFLGIIAGIFKVMMNG